MPKLFMLIGLPGSGKSTFVQNLFDDSIHYELSTDSFIESWAKMNNTTYDACFEEAIKHAEKHLENELKKAIHFNGNIIWDQTNLSIKSRKKKLDKIPANYTKIAIVFTTIDLRTLAERLKSRPGKTIPNHVIMSMMESFRMPTKDEGFDFIYEVKS